MTYVHQLRLYTYNMGYFSCLLADPFVLFPNWFRAQCGGEVPVIRPPCKPKHLCSSGLCSRLWTRSPGCDNDSWSSNLLGAFSVDDSVLNAKHAQFSPWWITAGFGIFVHSQQAALIQVIISLQAEVQVPVYKLRCESLANLWGL